MSKYSIDQFSEITGITKFVLRTWENRYGYPKAERTKTNIRLYTDEMISQALNTNYLLKNGYKISKIAKLSSEEIREAVYQINLSDSDAKEDYYIHEIISATLQFDPRKFDKAYKEGIELYGVLDFYQHVILKCLHKIGLLWQTQRVAPSQEHFVSELIKQKIAVETDRLTKKPKKGKRWLLFLPENEWHEIGLLFAKFLLVQEGHTVINLGANVPFESLTHVSENTSIDNTLFFAITHASKSRLEQTLLYLDENFGHATHYIVTSQTELNEAFSSPKIKILNSIEAFTNYI